MDDLDALYDQLDAYADSIRAKDRLIEQQAKDLASAQACCDSYAVEKQQFSDKIEALTAEVMELQRDAESWRAHMREIERVQDMVRGGFGRDGALAQGRVMAEWQPIDTAPKDGSEVLLYLGAPWSKIEKARWYAPWSNWQCGVIPSDPVREEYFGIGSSVPTHWMPLPLAPDAVARDNEPNNSGRHCPLDGGVE